MDSGGKSTCLPGACARTSPFLRVPFVAAPGASSSQPVTPERVSTTALEPMLRKLTQSLNRRKSLKRPSSSNIVEDLPDIAEEPYCSVYSAAFSEEAMLNFPVADTFEAKQVYTKTLPWHSPPTKKPSFHRRRLVLEHNDGWKWRKCGQKPLHSHSGPKLIRAYYRCSYLKSEGCQARKQVDFRKDDPDCIVALDSLGEHTCHFSRKRGGQKRLETRPSPVVYPDAQLMACPSMEVCRSLESGSIYDEYLTKVESYSEEGQDWAVVPVSAPRPYSGGALTKSQWKEVVQTVCMAQPTEMGLQSSQDYSLSGGPTSKRQRVEVPGFNHSYNEYSGQPVAGSYSEPSPVTATSPCSACYSTISEDAPVSPLVLEVGFSETVCSSERVGGLPFERSLSELSWEVESLSELGWDVDLPEMDGGGLAVPPEMPAELPEDFWACSDFVLKDLDFL